MLAHGNVVVLESVSSNKSLRVYDDGRIDGTGGSGALGKYNNITQTHLLMISALVICTNS